MPISGHPSVTTFDVHSLGVDVGKVLVEPHHTFAALVQHIRARAVPVRRPVHLSLTVLTSMLMLRSALQRRGQHNQQLVIRVMLQVYWWSVMQPSPCTKMAVH